MGRGLAAAGFDRHQRGAVPFFSVAIAILSPPAFFATSITLGVIAKINSGPSDILDRIPQQNEQGTGEGILDLITPDGADDGDAGAPAEPQVPSGQ